LALSLRTRPPDRLFGPASRSRKAHFVALEILLVEGLAARQVDLKADDH
jgi:hypothetical protein